MTTTVVDVVPVLAPVLHLPARPSVDPAPVQDCHYCELPFEPTPDPDGGEPWDLDELGRHCCDTCYCSSPNCLVGHYPDQVCPSAPEPADDIADREAAAVYGDPDAVYGERCDNAE